MEVVDGTVVAVRVGTLVVGAAGFVFSSASASNSGCSLGTEFWLVDGGTVAGNQSFPAPGGGNETGHSGNGYARITLVE